LGEHSQKPKEVHYRLEKLYGEVKRIELFARDKVQGWDLWGNEAPENNVSF
ncbi:MT-A70 family methyltransferase, partial [Arsenophonus sp.]